MYLDGTTQDTSNSPRRVNFSQLADGTHVYIHIYIIVDGIQF